MIKYQLQRTKQDLLKTVKTLEAELSVKKVIYRQIQKLNLNRLYGEWVRNGYEDEGFQYLIIDEIKENILSNAKNIDSAILDDYLGEIVFNSIS